MLKIYASTRGRVCYGSTHKIGTAPNFLQARVREGHEDIIEHAGAVMRIKLEPNTENPYSMYASNKYINVTFESKDKNTYLLSANLRVWLDLFRKGLDCGRDLIGAIAPKIFNEFDTGDFQETTPSSTNQNTHR